MAEINNIPDFEAMAKKVLDQLAKDIGQKALSHFKGSFLKQGFTDYSFIPWPQRQDSLGHKILRRSDLLMQDVKVTSQTAKRIEIGTSLNYADIHNSGGRINMTITLRMRRYFWAMHYKTGDDKWKFMALTKKKRLSIRIPQRQFIGDSHILNQNIDKLIKERIIKALQG